jgi:hypothetical protein
VASASRRGILTRDGIEGIAKVITIATTIATRDGGPESGNWGHAGRPGQVGGSSPGGGRTSEAARQEKIQSININFEGDTILPGLNRETLRENGLPDKPVLLKSNIIEKNELAHPDVAHSEYKEIIGAALYRPERVLKANAEKPYLNFISRTGENKSAIALLDVTETKDNFEIVNLHWARDESREQKEALHKRIEKSK